MRQNIKVLHTEWSDGWGGQEIRIVNEMLAIRKTGAEVFLACKENSKIRLRAEAENIPVFILPFRGNADLVTLFKLVTLIKAEGINIVNTHSGKDTWVGGLAAKISGIKFIRTRHLSNKINPARHNFINELADYIFTTGEAVRQDMVTNNRIDANKIMSVPTGIDEVQFDASLYNKNKLREELGFKIDDIIVGIVAVLRGFKRHDLFLQMAKSLLAEKANIKFLIVGDGPQKENIIALIKEHGLTGSVILTGHVDDVPSYMAILDVFVLSSDSNEGVPQSVMQALLMSLPVIATDVGGTKDLLKNDNFVLIPPNDIKTMCEKASLLLNDDELRVQYKTRAREYIVENFSATKMTEKITSIYAQLLNH